MEKNICCNIAKIFKEYRTENDLTQEKLGLLMNVGISTIRKKESGRYNFTLKNLLSFISLKGINKKDKEYLKTVIKTLQTKEKTKEFHAENELIEKLLAKIEVLEKELKLKNTLLKPKKSQTYEDSLKRNAFLSDFDTTTRLIPLIWELRDQSTKTYSEIELLLEINDPLKNKKIKKGLTKVANDIIDMGEKLLSYIKNDQESDIIDL